MSATNLGRYFWDVWTTRSTEPLLHLHNQAKPLTGSRLSGLVAHLAIGLREAGVEPGQRILIEADARSETLLLCIASWMLGAVTIMVAPNTPDALMAQALERMKATWILADQPSSLARLELLGEDALRQAQIILLEGLPKEPPARMTSYELIETQGRKLRDRRMKDLAKAMMEVPSDARTTILYWAEGEELKAAALTQEDLMVGLVPLPASLGLSRSDPLMIMAPLQDRSVLLTCLQALSQGHLLGFAHHTEQGPEQLKQHKPVMLLANADMLEALIKEIDHNLQEGSMRGTLKRSLGWIGKHTQDKAEVDEHLQQVQQWLSHNIADELVPALGGALRLVNLKGEASKDLTTLLTQASVRIVDAL